MGLGRPARSRHPRSRASPFSRRRRLCPEVRSAHPAPRLDRTQRGDPPRHRLSRESCMTPTDAPVLQLPTDRPRRMRGAGLRQSVDRPIAAELTRPLEAIADSLGADRHTVILTLFAATLGRLTGEEVLAIAVPQTWERPESRLPLRIPMDAAAPFEALLLRVHEALGEARAKGTPAPSPGISAF